MPVFGLRLLVDKSFVVVEVGELVVVEEGRVDCVCIVLSGLDLGKLVVLSLFVVLGLSLVVDIVVVFGIVADGGIGVVLDVVRCFLVELELRRPFLRELRSLESRSDSSKRSV